MLVLPLNGRSQMVRDRAIKAHIIRTVPIFPYYFHVNYNPKIPTDTSTIPHLYLNIPF